MNEPVSKEIQDFYQPSYDFLFHYGQTEHKLEILYHYQTIELTGYLKEGSLVFEEFDEETGALEFLFSAVQPIPNPKTGTLYRKESTIRCHAKDGDAFYYYKMLTTYCSGPCLLGISGTLTQDLIPTIEITSLDAIDLPYTEFEIQDKECLSLSAIFVGTVVDEPVLSMDDTNGPYASYTIEVDDADGKPLYIPCKAFGCLCENAIPDFHKESRVLVVGALQTALHRDGSVDFMTSTDMNPLELYVVAHTEKEYTIYNEIYFGEDLDF